MIQSGKILISSSTSNRGDLKPKYRETQSVKNQMELIKHVAHDFKRDSGEVGIVFDEHQAGGDRK